MDVSGVTIASDPVYVSVKAGVTPPGQILIRGIPVCKPRGTPLEQRPGADLSHIPSPWVTHSLCCMLITNEACHGLLACGPVAFSSFYRWGN